MQNNVRLVGTLGCHLCDEAAQVLQLLLIAFEYVEIMDDAELLAHYELSIPVLLKAHANTPENALCWPFNAESVRQWLYP